MKYDRLKKAYDDAVKFTKSHYENFPVVSFFLPNKLKKHIAVIYQFARQADDIADEGNYPIDFRLMLLENYKNTLISTLKGIYEDDFWMALGNTINSMKLTPEYFFNLLSAFEQDVTVTRYKTFDDLLNYCERSANPVGRLILELFDIRDEKVMDYSDAVCTALQLTNFYQDISIDYKKNRIYLPLNEMKKFGVSENIFELKKNNANFKQLLKFHIEKTKELFNKGKNILNYLPGILRLQIKLTILGGEKILEKIEELDYDTLNYRPILSKKDLVNLFFRAIG
ncbi:MAG: squalene synthase HpnC [Melioribacter sp.]|uniref:squalene synthase HpnC n=1 Tax=Rosettibacter primus TaxID=3111523 RepID=UPI00247E2091|nr:squalene synthase HpnC [Melioribacter sp.]